MKYATLLLAIAVTGCAHITTHQLNKTTSAGNESHVVETTTRGTAFFSSAQNVANAKLGNSDKGQTVGVSQLGQQGATNSVEVLQKILEILKVTGAAAP